MHNSCEQWSAYHGNREAPTSSLGAGQAVLQVTGWLLYLRRFVAFVDEESCWYWMFRFQQSSDPGLFVVQYHCHMAIVRGSSSTIAFCFLECRQALQCWCRKLDILISMFYWSRET